MPFKSQAQRRKFYSDPKLRKYAAEYEADTPKKLPERVRPKKKAHKPARQRHKSKAPSPPSMLGHGPMPMPPGVLSKGPKKRLRSKRSYG